MIDLKVLMIMIIDHDWFDSDDDNDHDNDWFESDDDNDHDNHDNDHDNEEEEEDC